MSRTDTMRILVTGSTGFVGTPLVAAFERKGHEVVRLVRRPPLDEREIRWDPAARRLDQAAVEGFDAVVHLAGENIASGRWTPSQRAAIRESRVGSTGLLCARLAACERRPRVVVSASAVGIYGDRGDEELSEDSRPGSGFLADVGRAWEGATEPLAATETRVVMLRLGIVLAPHGGALAKMLLPFRLGLGGVLGSGEQYLGWITLADAVRAFQHCVADDSLRGPVNGVAPHPVTNREFTKALGRALRRPTILPVPAFALRIAVGGMADEALLASVRVVPKRLCAAGFSFEQPELEPALRAMLA
jgi:hypothetical protein